VWKPGSLDVKLLADRLDRDLVGRDRPALRLAQRGLHAPGQLPGDKVRRAGEPRHFAFGLPHVRRKQADRAVNLGDLGLMPSDLPLQIDDLLGDLSALGEEARAINELIGKDGPGVIDLVQARMAGILDSAEKLAGDADTADMQDISRQAEALRQQIAATKNNSNWTFRTIARPDVASTVPSNGTGRQASPAGNGY